MQTYVEETPYTRLCSSKKILTVNGSFPGPTLYMNKGDMLIVNVYNNGTQNITIHWHGIKQVRYPWSDGPEYITQCPIAPGANFSQRIELSDEEGTVWWHAHSDWSRVTVHGAVVIYPKNGSKYPFPKPDDEIQIVLGEWWKSDIQAVLDQFLAMGGDPNTSDAYLINGQPGDLYPCSKNDTYKLTVQYDKTYLLRMVNAVMDNILFFSIANHQITVVGTDGAYTKPLTSDYITISPGQTIDFLLHANQTPNHYYMATKAYNSARAISFGRTTTTTAVLQYAGNYTPTSPLPFPVLPAFNDINASVNFTGRLRSLADANHPIDVPLNISTNLFFTVSINTLSCNNTNSTCTGPNGKRFAASVNNNSFVLPQIDILEAYYYHIDGVYSDNFPSFPPLVFNFTASNLSTISQTANRTTEVRVLEYNETVELVLQGTNLVAEIDHPMHLHGYSFYVVGWGFGNFDKDKDPLNYNLVDPPLQNTIAVPKNGWTAIRFKANNPGVWFMHCHLERHTSWGMEMAFIVKDGNGTNEKLMPPPPDMPKC
ncbi:laccase-14-like [Ipomoea triloba]|uniref:laccase-14-like n=1 Tax=Ipomoea triloba TaxID=35885 RepID=UPI00125D8D0B|nr:laccase-14-like [Ipomoea triloba]